jgi:hypothetical protein
VLDRPLLTTRAALGALAAMALAVACASDPAPAALGSDADAGGPSSSGEGNDGGAGDADGAAPDAFDEDDTPWSSGLEACGNGIDDDGDGLIDEDCAPSLFVGVFPPGGGDDLASGGHVAKMEADLGRPLAVLQSYRSTTAAGAAVARAELGVIWAHGAVAHLYFEPGDYTPAQYAASATDPVIDADLHITAKAVADALVDHPTGRLLLSFGAEMNGNWTDWGCKNASAATFIATTRKFHDDVAQELAARAIDPRRVRWVFAPNATSSGGGCGSAAAYYPGHDAVDLLGMSAYRAGIESVDVAVLAPSKKLMADLAYPAEWQHDRFIVLQTGSRTITGDDRGAWLTSLVQKLAADPAYAGVIPFDLSDADPTRDWALLDRAKPPVGRSGYDAFIGAAQAVPPSDRALEGTFDPYFWDVRVGDPSYAEIQALRGAHVTSGCSAAPPLFCPAALLTHGDAAAVLAGAFKVSAADAAAALGNGAGGAPDSVARAALASALSTLMKAKRPAATKDLARLASDVLVDPTRPATRAEAAAWIVHYARIAPAPRP